VVSDREFVFAYLNDGAAAIPTVWRVEFAVFFVESELGTQLLPAIYLGQECRDKGELQPRQPQ
jgi:hypothetical protein